ncbi:MAG: radical SAM protein [Eggerthellaceae bacterium]|nr:radical SAM protein [Eggerthellaceae bacterium]
MSILESVKSKAVSAAVMKAYDMLCEDFDGNLPKVVAMINRFRGQGDYGNEVTLNSFNMVAEKLADREGNWRQLLDYVMAEIDPDMARLFLQNFFVNSVAIGMNRQRRVTEKHGCNVPWAILIDPTTACNLNCVGCWAAHYEDTRHMSLTYEELDSVISQGKEMGTFIYLFTGGEPLVRKRDVIRLCEKHQDCFFSAFTNGTLIDEAFADEMLRVKNFMPAFSIEGNREATDARRGEGTYDKVSHAMDILRERKLPFGASICYTSQNYDSVTSDEFVNFLVEKGVLFAWIFTYMPIGHGAPVELLATAEQRSGMYYKVRDDWR